MARIWDINMTEVKRMREALNMSQREFGSLINVTQKQLSRYENKKAIIPHDVKRRISRCEYFRKHLPADESWDYMDYQAMERLDPNEEIKF